MTETTDIPTSPIGALSAPASVAVPARASVLRLPSARASAMLAGAMLALGVAIGAAIGPAPDSSFAGASRLPLLLPSLTALALTRAAGHASAASAKPPAVRPQATPTAAAEPSARPAPSSSHRSSSAVTSPTSSAPKPPGSSAVPTTGAGGPTKALPPVTNVWLIELSGTSFAAALASPAASPYIDGQAVPGGALLSGWSAVDGSAFANEAALLASTPPQLLTTIVEPPCPEGPAGAQCALGTPGALTAADEFLKASLPTITATTAYRTHGLIVVTLGSITSASATGLPSGASNTTLTSEPPSGVLLISPFISLGSRPATVALNPASPRLSLEKLLHQ